MGTHFSEWFGKVVGDGRETKLWEDGLIGDRKLKERFTRLYHLESNNGATIAEKGHFIGEEWVWRWGWRREPRGREMAS